ncbi:LacI family DNA-binding transcriptional regulator [Pseudolysinimonas yzui]|uniref:LacI family transcriptional regulator n=1 Tax=Pseudolysinimonas yzui TaxID=2708254 RepID=A0A8J3DSM1_9MICO|nr:LacI family DNA-binding transcriptional regulator [Pseudolysinimonas yzui]GHF05258.1 LacI family transcriptional regulator [Pseudolysinimonas yzui]
MAVTIHDVALLSGFSIKTVSKVMNGVTTVKPDTRERVQRAIAQLGYRPNASARGLRSGKSGLIGLAVPTIKLAFFAELSALIIAEAHSRGLGVVVEQTTRQDVPHLAVASSSGRIADGVIFSPVLADSLDVQTYDAGTPLVSLDETSGPLYDTVSIDNTGATRAATEHLLAMGCRRIALAGADAGPVHSPLARLRMRGYVEALDAAGIPFRPELLAGSENHWEREGGADAFERLLDARVPFDGLVCLTDGLALGAIRAAASRGVRVPDDVAIVGFDDIEDSRYAVPALSTVEPGKREMARLSVELLIQRIADPLHPPVTLFTRFKVIARESSARNPGPPALGIEGAR